MSGVIIIMGLLMGGCLMGYGLYTSWRIHVFTFLFTTHAKVCTFINWKVDGHFS
jgi:hypothetical protein